MSTGRALARRAGARPMAGPVHCGLPADTTAPRPTTADPAGRQYRRPDAHCRAAAALCPLPLHPPRRRRSSYAAAQKGRGEQHASMQLPCSDAATRASKVYGPAMETAKVVRHP
eukprot:gene11684-17053_t